MTVAVDSKKAKIEFEKFLELIQSNKEIDLTSIEPGASNLSIALSNCMYAAKECNHHDEVHNLFKDLYNEFGGKGGTLTTDQRDLENINKCLKRMDEILAKPQGNPEWTDVLMTDLRKLLSDQKAPKEGALLSRCGFEVLLPSVFCHKPPKDLPSGVKLISSVPMGNQPLTARLDVLFGINDWNEQLAFHFNKDYSFKDIIKIFSNIQGAHADTQERITNNHSKLKSNNLTLLRNKEICRDVFIKFPHS
ncbi:MAG: hypothetical protein JXQ99_06765 [Hyphomicrobiaceae bacterium]